MLAKHTQNSTPPPVSRGRALSILATLLVTASTASSGEPHRSPVDLVVGPDGSWLMTVNQTSDSVSLVDPSARKVLDEIPVGERPVAAALCPDGQHVLVSSSDAGHVTLLRVAGGRLSRGAVIRVGFSPHGIAVSPNGRSAYVALTTAGEVAVIDLERCCVRSRVRVGKWPRFVALSPDGTRLAVGASGDRGLSMVDTTDSTLLFTQQFVGLNIGHLCASADGQHVYFPWMVYRRNPISVANIRRGWVLASRVARMSWDDASRPHTLSMDPPGKAVADLCGLAITRDERRIVISASGTHELLLLTTQDAPWEPRGSSDHIPAELLEDENRFSRIELGGRPMGLRIAADDRTVYVANYLLDAIQIVDLHERRLVNTIALGGPDELSVARRGEEIFFDARRSLDQWYSCHSCHFEGGSNAVVMDTMNDGSAFTFKTVPALYGVHATGPWTWHGWQQNLSAAIAKSMVATMLGPEPVDDDVAAVAEYLGTLRPPAHTDRASAASSSEAADRGRELFHGSAGCAVCHAGPHLTDGQIHDVGLSSPGDKYDGFNTPSLIGVGRKVLWLHDGRAKALEQLLADPHDPAKVSGSAPLSAEDRHDLIEYLNTL